MNRRYSILFARIFFDCFLLGNCELEFTVFFIIGIQITRKQQNNSFGKILKLSVLDSV